MADNHSSTLPPPSPEHRRVAAGQFDRANQVIAKGNYDYGINLLLTSCKLDPANLVYRQTLRRTEKIKFKNNLYGSRLALLTNSATKARLLAARRARNYLKILELGEAVLIRNPWDTGTQIDMAEAADALGLLDMAIWILEQARQKDNANVSVNRRLARLYEKRGNFSQAVSLWILVRKAHPDDGEAQQKAKDLAASATIARGRYSEMIQPEPIAKSETSSEGKEAPAAGNRVSTEVASLRAKITADPKNPQPYLQLAAQYRRADQWDEARELLEGGLGPTGNHFDLTIEIAAMDIEPFRRNLSITDEKLRTNAQDEELRKIRIRLLKEINTRELDLYRQKSQRYPNEKENRFELGVRLLRANQVDEAIRELQAARGDTRYQWRALLYLGHAFKGRNNWRLAQRNFEEALKSLPASEDGPRKEVLFQLAQGEAEAGKLAHAVDWAHELANLDFTYREIGRLLDEWQQRLDKGKAADKNP